MPHTGCCGFRAIVVVASQFIYIHHIHRPRQTCVLTLPQSEPEFVTFEIVPGLCEGSIKHRKV